MDNDVCVINDVDEQRFKIQLEEGCAYLAYKNNGQTIDLYRVFVPESLRGKGVASILVREGLRYAREHHLSVIPTCSYVKTYLQRKALTGK